MTLEQQYIRLACAGYAVFPLAVTWDEFGRKTLEFPEGQAWHSYATSTLEQLHEMDWGSATHVGIDCGGSGIAVLDYDVSPDDDGPHDDRPIGMILEHDHKIRAVDLDGTENMIVSTRSGGAHVYFQDLAGAMRTSTKRVHERIDIKAAGGMVIYYPSDAAPLAVDSLPPVPAWVARANTDPREKDTVEAEPHPPRYNPGEDGSGYGLSARKAELERLGQVWDADNGNFNNTLNEVAFRLGQLTAGGELEYDSTREALESFLRDRDAWHQYKTLESGWLAGYRHPDGRPRDEGDTSLTPEDLDMFESHLLDIHQLSLLPPPTWLIDGWLETDSLARMVGPSGSCKSFVALDMAASVSVGRCWSSGREMAQMPQLVVYVAAEGVRGVTKRVRAWEHEHGPVGAMLFLPFPAGPALSNSPDDHGFPTKEWRTLIEVLRRKKPAMVIFDTQAQIMGELEENSATHMGMFVRQMNTLREATGACVMLVHHTAKNTENGATARGSTAVTGALETEMKVSKKSSKITISISKQKNDEAAAARYFTVTPAEGTKSIYLTPVKAQAKTELSADDSEKLKTNMRKSQILQLLRDEARPMTATEIGKALNLSRNYVNKLLDALDGKIKIDSIKVRGQQTRRVSVPHSPTTLAP